MRFDVHLSWCVPGIVASDEADAIRKAVELIKKDDVEVHGSQSIAVFKSEGSVN